MRTSGADRRRHSPQREHRPEVRRERQVDVELDRLAAVEVDVDPLLQRRVVEQPPVEPELQRLQRQPAAAGQLQVGIGELVDRTRAGRRGHHEKPRAGTADAQLVTEQEAAVVAVDAERVGAVDRHVAVGLADDERVAGLQYDCAGEVNRVRAHAPRSGVTAAAGRDPERRRLKRPSRSRARS